MSKKRKHKLPTSGDRLVDWHFRQIVDVLEKGIYAIRKKKRLVSMDDKPPRKAVSGLYAPDLDMIFLNAAKSHHPNWQDSVATLIHEAGHKIHPLAKHRSIEALERTLMIKFTDEQKRYLRKLIPQREVKKDPPPAKDIPEIKEGKKEPVSAAPETKPENQAPETATPEPNNEPNKL